MELVRIANILNRIIKAKGFPSSALIRGKFNPLVIEYDDYEEILTYKILKKIVDNELMNFQFSSNTGKSIVEELYRVLKSIKTTRFKEAQIRKIVPSVIRSVLNINPYELRSTLQKLYEDFIAHTKDFETQWAFQPDEEREELVVEIFKIFAQIFLLTHNNLPGINFKSTIAQINLLISQLTTSLSDEFEDREIYMIGKAARSASDLQKHKETIENSSVNWYKTISEFMDLVSRMIHKGVIEWVVITDNYNRELYSQYKDTKNKYQNLIGMALSGVQQIVNEVTADRIKLIEQDDGYIYIERKELFHTFFFVKSNLTDYLKFQIAEFVDHVDEEYGENIKSFNGNIRDLKLGIDTLLKENLRMMI